MEGPHPSSPLVGSGISYTRRPGGPSAEGQAYIDRIHEEVCERLFDDAEAEAIEILKAREWVRDDAVEELELPGLRSIKVQRSRVFLSLSAHTAALEAAEIRSDLQKLKKQTHPHVQKTLGTFYEYDPTYHTPSRRLDVIRLAVPGIPLHVILTRLAKDGIVDSDRIKRWFGCLSSGLEFIHNHGICLGEIRTSSIVCRGEQICFTNLDYRRPSMSSSAKTPRRSRTVLYWREYAPDIESLARDVFSLGLVFLEMLAVLVGEDLDTLRRHIYWNHEITDSDDDEVERIERRKHRSKGLCLYLDPSERWSSHALATHTVEPALPPRLHEHGIYKECIARMLQEHPGDRPSASAILGILRTRRQSLLGTFDSCDSTLAADCATPVPATGWQLGDEKFLWDSAAGTALEVTDRGFLGHGRTGLVEEVVVPGFGIPMARKQITMRSTDMTKALAKRGILSEIDNLKSLEHKHIVKVLGCYQEPSGMLYTKFYVLMHPVGDSDLAMFLEEIYRVASPKEKIKYASWIDSWFTCLTSALAYLHSCGIRHEDIKPANIIHRDGIVYFTDFNSSRKITSWDETSTESPAAATRLFAAPEAMYSGDTMYRHGSKTDVFSLGLVFVEMLTVIADEEVNNLREFVFRDIEGVRQYHRVEDRFLSWFNNLKMHHGRPALAVYQDYISKMLGNERKERASASSMAGLFSERAANLCITSCDCHWIRWEGRQSTIDLRQDIVSADQSDEDDDDFVMV